MYTLDQNSTDKNFSFMIYILNPAHMVVSDLEAKTFDSKVTFHTNAIYGILLMHKNTMLYLGLRVFDLPYNYLDISHGLKCSGTLD